MKTRILVLVVLIIAAIIRLINLNQSLWLDEAITALAVKNNSLVEILSRFSPGDFHPPLYYLFLKLWTNFFGYSEIVLRLPSVFFGVLAVYFIYKIGGKKAAVLIAVNPLAVYYSQEARMYSLAMLLVTMTVYFFINRQRKLFILSFLAALYTDYVPWLMLPVFFSVDLFFVFLFLLPLGPLLFHQFMSSSAVAGSTWGDILGRASFKNLFLVPAKFIFGRVSLHVSFYATFTAVYGYFMTFSRNRIFWSWFLAPLALGLLLSFKIPIFTYFRFLFVLPAFILLVSSGKRWQIIVVVLVSLFSLAYFNLNSRFWREDWRGVVAYIQQEPGLVLIPNVAQGAPLDYYDQKYSDKLSPAKTVYLLRYLQEIFDPEDNLRIDIEEAGYQKVSENAFNGVLVWSYENRN